MTWLWLGLGALVAVVIYKSGREAEREAQKERQREQERGYVLDGALMPVAVDLFAGKITSEEADRQVIDLDTWTQGVWPRWNRMGHAERLEMGRLALEVYSDPTFQERQGRLVSELNKAIGRNVTVGPEPTT